MNKVSEIKLIREYVRTIAKKIKKEQKEKLKEETQLRKHIRRMINEVEEVSPHSSTGINVLEDLLKTIVPVIEVGYKRLTTDEGQRESFRSHILRAVQNLLSTESVYLNVDKNKKNKAAAVNTGQEMPNAGLAEQDEDPSANKEAGKAGVEKDPSFIDIDKEKKQKNQQAAAPKPEDAFEPIKGEDPTGRSFALRTFQKVQKQILDSYSLLGKEEDKELFYDYLITNLNLYHDKFEDELQTNLESPTTPEYEAEKQKKQQTLGGASTVAQQADVGADQMAAGPGEEGAETGAAEIGSEEEPAAGEEELEIELDEDLEEEEED
jgi:hypothetical protein